ncbi:MAG TPA: cation-transporting P-type ATPase [Aestuariivirgaceae bacterium]|nr:cation-transporting P-type ATPase [Aestuariivirgaceae bacterium]
MAREPQPTKPGEPWHAMAADEVLAHFETSPEGLTSEEADRRRGVYGPNRLPETASRGPLLRLLAQFNSLLIYVLLAAAILAALIGHHIDALVILAVVVANAVIGFIQEGRAEQALNAIRTMIDPHASVIRDGRRLTVAAEDIVPGDFTMLDAGDRVPADLRLVRARNLRIDEAILTGESVAVEKAAGPVDAGASLGDRFSVAFSGTFVAAGHGAGVAVATGAETELGHISTLIGSVERLKTPLIRQMDRFANVLTIDILAISAAVFGFAWGLRNYALPDAFMTVVGLAVAAIPEGLPAVITITLAIGVQRMAARKAIIRRLPAVEALGSVSVICSDKTGTFTRNEMMASTVLGSGARLEVSGEGYAPRGTFLSDGAEVDPGDDPSLSELIGCAALCNDAELRQVGDNWIVAGDPMEGALISLALKAGKDAAQLKRDFPRTDEIPFDAQHRYMATLHHSHAAGAFVYLKGAPEQILAMCTRQMGNEGPVSIDPDYWLDQTEALAGQGQRVLAFATKPMPSDQQTLTFSDAEHGATLLGLIGLIDPPREEAIAAVGECHSAGIRVIMITGDHGATAGAIARQLGLSEDPKVVAGQELEALDPAGLQALVKQATVFARTSPENKLRLVEALQATGAVVAMTGDGVNDAPTLKRADIGVAMGIKGTEAAKEASEMVLADDNFASIVAAVREGRTAYDNLKKVIAWTLPTNGGESFAIIGAVLFGLTLPVTPIQILWVNMVTAIALGLTLAFEPTEPGTMRRPPRAPDEPFLSKLLVWRIVFVSVLFVIAVYGVFFWALQRGLSLELARTMVVNTLVVCEIFYLFSVRYVHGPSLTWTGVLGTPAVLIGVGVVVIAQLIFTYLPWMHLVFATRPVALADGLVIVGIGVALFLVIEAEKQLIRIVGGR